VLRGRRNRVRRNLRDPLFQAAEFALQFFRNLVHLILVGVSRDFVFKRGDFVG
jgi:hypothetical protein